MGFAGSGGYSDGMLDWQNGDAFQDNAATAKIDPAWSVTKGSRGGTIGGAESADQLRRQTRLVSQNGSNTPASHYPVHDSAAVGHGLTLAEGQVVGAVGMEDVPDIKQR